MYAAALFTLDNLELFLHEIFGSTKERCRGQISFKRPEQKCFCSSLLISSFRFDLTSATSVILGIW